MLSLTEKSPEYITSAEFTKAFKQAIPISLSEIDIEAAFDALQTDNVIYVHQFVKILRCPLSPYRQAIVEHNELKICELFVLIPSLPKLTATNPE